MLGERLMPELVKLLDGPAVSYGKGAIVDVHVEVGHGGACFTSSLAADVGCDRWRQGSDLFERDGCRGRREPRCAAWPQGRLLVLSVLRYDNMTAM
jgi:hypothetical protein